MATNIFWSILLIGRVFQNTCVLRTASCFHLVGVLVVTNISQSIILLIGRMFQNTRILRNAYRFHLVSAGCGVDKYWPTITHHADWQCVGSVLIIFPTSCYYRLFLFSVQHAIQDIRISTWWVVGASGDKYWLTINHHAFADWQCVTTRLVLVF